MKLSSIHILSVTVSTFISIAIASFAMGQPKAGGLFESDEPLFISLHGEVRELLKDRAAVSTLHKFALVYKEENGQTLSIPVQVRTRGNFRRLKENCAYPPLMIQFVKGQQSASIFHEQSKLKLVMPCAADEYVIREWLVYKIYNLISPRSFKARLVKVQLEQTQSRKTAGSFYGILLEEEKQMARRNKMFALNKRLLPNQMNSAAFHAMAVFEYLIGNTDWSIEFLQNIKLISNDSMAAPIPVPYDFDHAGIVRAPYAHPPEGLQMHSTRERRYRGYCITNMKIFEPVINKFNLIKNDLYNLYETCSLLDSKYKRFVIQYLDEFYETINNSKAWKKDFSYPCDKSGTGNIVVKGLTNE